MVPSFKSVLFFAQRVPPYVGTTSVGGRTPVGTISTSKFLAPRDNLEENHSSQEETVRRYAIAASITGPMTSTAVCGGAQDVVRPAKPGRGRLGRMRFVQVRKIRTVRNPDLPFSAYSVAHPHQKPVCDGPRERRRSAGAHAFSSYMVQTAPGTWPLPAAHVLAVVLGVNVICVNVAYARVCVRGRKYSSKPPDRS